VNINYYEDALPTYTTVGQYVQHIIVVAIIIMIMHFSVPKEIKEYHTLLFCMTISGGNIFGGF
jgi:hypothetical protein